MAQKRTPSTFSSLLVSDRVDPVSKALNPRPSDSRAAVAEIQSDRGALLVSRVTKTVLEALAQKDPVTGLSQAVNGMMAYQKAEVSEEGEVTEPGKFVFFEEGKWLSFPLEEERYVEGPESSDGGDAVVFGEGLLHPQTRKASLKGDPVPVPAHLVKGPLMSVPGHVAVFNNDTGSEIADSGLNVQKILRFKGLGASDLLQLSNLGALQFVNGLGVILVDDLIPATFVTRGTGVDAQVCTVFGGDLPAESSSPSALVEINSPTGAFLISRMTTLQRKKLADPKNGMMVYDTDLKSFMFRQKEEWVPLSSGSEGAGDVTGPSQSLKGEIPLFEGLTGKQIGQSGVMMDNDQKMTGLKSMRLSTPGPYDQNYSLWADSGVVALDYYVLSSGKFKHILARDEEIHEEAESLFKALSFVKYTRHQALEETGQEHFGLIAEEVAEIAPSLVREHEEGIALNKGGILDAALVVVQKVLKENKALQKQQERHHKKLDYFIKTFNQRAKKNGYPSIEFDEEEA